MAEQIRGDHFHTTGTTGYYVLSTEVIDASRVLKNVIIDGGTVMSDGVQVAHLNADLLDGYSFNEFVLKSEIGDKFCRAYCPVIARPQLSD